MKYQNNTVSWWDQLHAQFSGYPVWLVEGVFAAIVGFLFGFIMRNFGRPLLYGLAVLLVAGYIASYLGFAEFHFEQLQSMVGIVEIPTIDVAFSNLFSWMREHVALCIGALLGFAFGWRMGG